MTRKKAEKMQVVLSSRVRYCRIRCSVHRHSYHRPMEVLEAPTRMQQSQHHHPKTRPRHREVVVTGPPLHLLLRVMQLRPHRHRQTMRQPGWRRRPLRLSWCPRASASCFLHRPERFDSP